MAEDLVEAMAKFELWGKEVEGVELEDRDVEKSMEICKLSLIVWENGRFPLLRGSKRGKEVLGTREEEDSRGGTKEVVIPVQEGMGNKVEKRRAEIIYAQEGVGRKEKNRKGRLTEELEEGSPVLNSTDTQLTLSASMFTSSNKSEVRVAELGEDEMQIDEDPSRQQIMGQEKIGLISSKLGKAGALRRPLELIAETNGLEELGKRKKEETKDDDTNLGDDEVQNKKMKLLRDSLASLVITAVCKRLFFIGKPLIELLKKNAFVWNPLANQVFLRFKKLMSSTLALTLLDFSQPFIMEPNTSPKAIKAILMKGGRLISFLSQAMGPKNQGPSIYEKEQLSLITTVTRWRHNLMGSRFIIRIDHQSLKCFWSQKSQLLFSKSGLLSC
ncbi:hypothetical protein ACH5RR_025617 [Cinchona calisaya]|uniref:Reverse transcriptase RNase H-like domain-containing protein n=1 Tax=Cinchona calisaya TaxID=153742 RepID=A0ABD2Z056_9GENT